MPDTEHPRGRDASNTLTEARTVLSRTENALERLGRGPQEYLYETDGRTPLDGDDGSWARAYDPDHDAIAEALRAVVALLEPWRRTGRPAGTEAQRNATRRGVTCACGRRLWASHPGPGHTTSGTCAESGETSTQHTD
jgi:hypothetical protein